jgi:hypothetical protein
MPAASGRIVHEFWHEGVRTGIKSIIDHEFLWLVANEATNLPKTAVHATTCRQNQGLLVSRADRQRERRRSNISLATSD